MSSRPRWAVGALVAAAGCAALLGSCSSGPDNNSAAPATTTVRNTNDTTAQPAPSISLPEATTGAPATTAPAGGSTTAGPSTTAGVTTTTKAGQAPVTPTSTDPEVPTDQLRAAYQQAFEAECRAIWSLSSDGIMKDPDDEESSYTVNDCLTELGVEGADAYSTIKEAQEGGKDDADLAAASLVGAGELCASNGKCFSP